jgi:hypothetical protein
MTGERKWCWNTPRCHIYSRTNSGPTERMLRPLNSNCETHMYCNVLYTTHVVEQPRGPVHRSESGVSHAHCETPNNLKNIISMFTPILPGDLTLAIVSAQCQGDRFASYSGFHNDGPLGHWLKHGYTQTRLRLTGYVFAFAQGCEWRHIN